MPNLAINKGISVLEITDEYGNSFHRHAQSVARGLRIADSRELRSATGKDPKDVVMTSWENSKRRFIIMKRNGDRTKSLLYVPVGVFGVADYAAEDGVGVPWMVATNSFDSVRLFVLKHSLRFIDSIKKDYKKLFNFVDVRNEEAVEWIRLCGFTVYKAAKYGAEGRMFHMFDMKGDL